VTRAGRQPRRATAVVVAGAFGLRAGWSAYAARPPLGLRDPFTYVALSRTLAAGHGYDAPFTHVATTYFPPGYAFFIAPLLWLTMHVGGLATHEPILVALANTACWTGAVYLTIRLARLVVDGRSALIAGALVAVWPNGVIGASVALSEPLLVVLVLGATVVALEGRGGMTMGRAVGAGVLFGLSALVRPVSLVFVVVVLVCATRARIATPIVAGTFVVAMLLAISPWTIRNATTMRAFVPISTNTGDDLCIGHHPNASGGFGYSDYCADAHAQSPGVAAEISRYHYATRQALHYAKTHPLEEVPLMGKRIWATVRNDADSVAASESYGNDPWMNVGLRRGLGVAANVFWWLLLLGALAGAVVLARSRPDWRARVVLLAPIALSLVPVLAFFGDPRFKTPAVPFLAILAAAAMQQLRARRAPSLAVAVPRDPGSRSGGDRPPS
jgi:hypothetical protein